MDLNAISDGLTTALETISGLRVYGFNADSISEPAAIISAPDQVLYDFTMDDGSHVVTVKIHVLVSRVSDRAASSALSAYINSTGAQSVKAAIEADTSLGGACQTLRVESASSSYMSVGSVDYLAATFSLNIVA